MPAFFNGVFGHKPTGGLVPGTGQYPIAENKALRYLATGPLARRAEDLMPLLRILAGPDGVDAECSAADLGDPASVSFRGLQVKVIEDNGALKVSGELRAAMSSAAEALAARGAVVSRVRVDGLKNSFDIWSSMLGKESTHSFRDLLGGGKSISPLRELFKLAIGRSRHTLPGLGLALLERLPELTPTRTERFIEQGRALRGELIEIIGDGVVLYPPYPSVAPRHNRPLAPPLLWVYTAILNVMELPVTQVPLGLNERGVPLGVQVVGGPLADHRTIAVAQKLEEDFGGWVPPRAICGDVRASA
jgi:fatty acid amide hydrolase 2